MCKSKPKVTTTAPTGPNVVNANTTGVNPNINQSLYVKPISVGPGPVNTNPNLNPMIASNVNPNVNINPGFNPAFNPNPNLNTSAMGNSLVPGVINQSMSSSQIVKQAQVRQNSLTSVLIGGTTNAPIDRKLQKSQVHVRQVNDPNIRNFFKDCVTERVQLTKVSNQHVSYVRQHDYFDLSNGHYTQLNAVRPSADTKMAQYGVSEASTLSTPSINKFVYNQNIIDVNYQPKNSVYKNNYKIMTEAEAAQQFAYSNVQPVFNNSQSQPYIPAFGAANNYNSTVRPYADTTNLVYNTQPYGDSKVYQQPVSVTPSSQIYNQPMATITNQPSYNSQVYSQVPVSVTGTSQVYNTSGANQTIITPPITSSTVRPVRVDTVSSSRQNSLGLLV